MIRFGASLAVLLALAACGSPTEGYRKKADSIARGAGLEPVIIAGKFDLQAYERVRDPNASVHIYIEGDGNAWLSSNMVSPDPTPRDPVALEMAGRDNSPNVVYLARVCQYVMNEACAPRYWTHAQFSDEVIGAYAHALNRWQGHKLELTGYSGGGAAAMLIAARRGDVVAIRTAAGNIDTDAFTAMHHVSPLSNSLNPASFMAATANIPQLHFSGEKDKIVPPSLSQAYQSKLPAGNCSATFTVPAIDHHTGWPEAWPGLLATPLPCAKN